MELENAKTAGGKREERMQKANELCLIAVFAMFGVLMRQGIGMVTLLKFLKSILNSLFTWQLQS